MNCNINLIFEALPLVFPTAIVLHESLSTSRTMSTGQTKDLAVCLYPHQGSGCVLLKKSLWKYTHLTDERCQNGCCLDKQRLLLVSLVLLALSGMVLLLLWNYQCFIVNHMCQDPERSSEYVLFDMDEQRLSSYGPA